MKLLIYTVLLILLLTSSINTQAQPTSAAQEADDLRLQLLDLQTQEEGLRARAGQLDEALKPENIERSLAGVGSTRPEELREARRRQLQIERDGVAAATQNTRSRSPASRSSASRCGGPRVSRERRRCVQRNVLSAIAIGQTLASRRRRRRVCCCCDSRVVHPAPFTFEK